jgi:hypothetical protein
VLLWGTTERRGTRTDCTTRRRGKQPDGPTNQERDNGSGAETANGRRRRRVHQQQQSTTNKRMATGLPCLTARSGLHQQVSPLLFSLSSLSLSFTWADEATWMRRTNELDGINFQLAHGLERRTDGTGRGGCGCAALSPHRHRASDTEMTRHQLLLLFLLFLHSHLARNTLIRPCFPGCGSAAGEGHGDLKRRQRRRAGDDDLQGGNDGNGERLRRWTAMVVVDVRWDGSAALADAPVDGGSGRATKAGGGRRTRPNPLHCLSILLLSARSMVELCPLSSLLFSSLLFSSLLFFSSHCGGG